MEIHYDLTLRGFLSHIQANVKRRAFLIGEYVAHPDNPERKAPEISDEVEVMWESLRRDLKKVIGVDLCPFARLLSDSTFDLNVGWDRGAPDPYRIRMGVLQGKADRARLKDPTITLLNSKRLIRKTETED
jgi:hypothetical protein